MSAISAGWLRESAICPCLLIWVRGDVTRSLHLCGGQKLSTVSAGWLLGEPDTEQAVAATEGNRVWR